jgi:hypothetical protein
VDTISAQLIACSDEPWRATAIGSVIGSALEHFELDRKRECERLAMRRR